MVVVGGGGGAAIMMHNFLIELRACKTLNYNFSNFIETKKG